MRTVVVVVAVLVLALGALWGLQRRLIYLPSGAPPPAAAALPGAREVELRTEDGLTLGAWLLAPHGSSDLGVAVLVANGNAGHRGVRAPLADALAARGLTVLLFDYRGFGGNAGAPSEQGLAADARAARRYLVAEAGFADERIVYYGESIGSAVLARLAVEHPPGGLVLRSPFPDLATVARHHYRFLPVGLLLRDRYPVTDQIGSIDAPTVVVYGTADRIVPSQLSLEVAAAAGEPIELVAVAGADHNNRALLDGEELVDAVVALARGLAEG